MKIQIVKSTEKEDYFIKIPFKGYFTGKYISKKAGSKPKFSKKLTNAAVYDDLDTVLMTSEKIYSSLLNKGLILVKEIEW